MEYNPIDDIWEFIQKELNLPYLYLKKIDKECITALFKDKDEGSVLLRVYKSDKGYVLHLDDVNSIALIHKTQFNKFMLMDYNAPDKFYEMPNSELGARIIEKILDFLNARFLESNLYDYLFGILFGPVSEQGNVRSFVISDPILNGINADFTETKERVLLKFSKSQCECLITRNQNNDEISIVYLENTTKHVTPDIMLYLNALSQKIGATNFTGKTSSEYNVDMVVLRNKIVEAFHELPNVKTYNTVTGNWGVGYYFDLECGDKQISMGIQIHKNSCVLKSSETEASYIFEYTATGGVSVRCTLNQAYADDKPTASLTTDTVSAVMRLLNNEVKVDWSQLLVTTPKTNQTEDTMKSKESKIDTLFNDVVKAVSDLSYATLPGDKPAYIVKCKNLHMRCEIEKRSDGVAITVDKQKVYKFYFGLFNILSLVHVVQMGDNFDSISQNIKEALSPRYPEDTLYKHLHRQYLNLYGEYLEVDAEDKPSDSFKVNLSDSQRLETLVITKVDDDTCHLTFNNPKYPHKLLLVKNPTHSGIDISFVEGTRKLPEELKPACDKFIEIFNVASQFVTVDDNNQFGNIVAAEPEKDEDYYPVVMRASSIPATKDNLHHLIGEGIRLLQEAYQLDDKSITMSETIGIDDEQCIDGVRRTVLTHTRVYYISSDKISTGNMLVVLPSISLPEVRTALSYCIWIDNVATEALIRKHDDHYRALENSVNQ